MKMTQSIVLALVTGTLSWTSAQASEIPSRGPIPFNTYDSDGNGAISEQEFDSAQAKRLEIRATAGLAVRNAPSAPSFSELDRNSDGQLSQDELLGGQKAQMLEHASMMDTGITPGIGRGYTPAFSKCDLNHDGILLENEFIEARGNRISERAKQGFLMRGLGRGLSFSEIDLDGDDRVTPDEFATADDLHRGNGAK